MELGDEPKLAWQVRHELPGRGPTIADLFEVPSGTMRSLRAKLLASINGKTLLDGLGNAALSRTPDSLESASSFSVRVKPACDADLVAGHLRALDHQSHQARRGGDHDNGEEQAENDVHPVWGEVTPDRRQQLGRLAEHPLVGRHPGV